MVDERAGATRCCWRPTARGAPAVGPPGRTLERLPPAPDLGGGRDYPCPNDVLEPLRVEERVVLEDGVEFRR
jgi:hypothetical protein